MVKKILFSYAVFTNNFKKLLIWIIKFKNVGIEFIRQSMFQIFGHVNTRRVCGVFIYESVNLRENTKGKLPCAEATTIQQVNWYCQHNYNQRFVYLDPFFKSVSGSSKAKMRSEDEI